MVKRRTDRCFLPAAGCSVARVRFPAQRAPPPHQVHKTNSPPLCTSSSTEERGGNDGQRPPGGAGSDGGSGAPKSKRGRQDGNEEAAAPTNRDKVPGSWDPDGDAPGPDQQGAAENNRAAELQSAGSLKVTIQRSSESREFGQTDRTPERQTGGLHCHVCELSCRSLQVFQEHMSGQEHLRKLQEITQSIHLNTHTLLDRGRRPDTQRWCDTCQTHFAGDVIEHRRTKQHKECKQLCRPFCPVCKRHFRTPRKFVEHMKSAEHKQQVQLQEAPEEELITVDAVGCFQEQEQEEEEEEAEVLDEEDEGGQTVAAQEEDEDEDEHGSSFVVPVCGFLCCLCNKFFYRETHTHTHCRTRTHRIHLQSHRAQTRKRIEEEHPAQDRSAQT